jgi:hypothetical protein
LITANTQERKLPSGNVFYLPLVSLDITNIVPITESDQAMFSDFMLWIDNYNTYIANAWQEKVNSGVSEEDMDTTDDFVDIEIEEDVA